MCFIYLVQQVQLGVEEMQQPLFDELLLLLKLLATHARHAVVVAASVKEVVHSVAF